MVEKLIMICDVLGVDYCYDYLNSLDNVCDKIDYLLNQIYKYLGGE
jgi:hypothetical protein